MQELMEYSALNCSLDETVKIVFFGFASEILVLNNSPFPETTFTLSLIFKRKDLIACLESFSSKEISLSEMLFE